MTGNDDERRDFSPQERAEIRAILVSHKRVAWLWSTIGVWIKWVFWIAAGVVSIKLAIGDYLRGLVK